MARDPDDPLYDPYDDPEEDELSYLLLSIWEVPEDEGDDDE